MLCLGEDSPDLRRSGNFRLQSTRCEPQVSRFGDDSYSANHTVRLNFPALSAPCRLSAPAHLDPAINLNNLARKSGRKYFLMPNVYHQYLFVFAVPETLPRSLKAFDRRLARRSSAFWSSLKSRWVTHTVDCLLAILPSSSAGSTGKLHTNETERN